jgi:hypothetical protein
MKRFVWVAILSILAIPSGVFASGVEVGLSCVVKWTRPQTNTDGTQLADLGGYLIFLARQPGQYDFGNPHATPPAAATEYLCSNMAVSLGQYYVVMRAVDISGNQSANSVEVPFVVVDKFPRMRRQKSW